MSASSVTLENKASSVTLENKIRARMYKLFLSTLLVAGIFFSIPLYLDLGFNGLVIDLFVTAIFPVLISKYGVRINYPLTVSISEKGVLFECAGKNRPLRFKNLNGRFGPKIVRLVGHLSIDWDDVKEINIEANRKLMAPLSSSKIIFNDGSWQSLTIVDKQIVDEIIKGCERFKAKQKVQKEPKP